MRANVLFAFLLNFFTSSKVVTAQNVNIPDTNFKAALVANLSINTNSDNEIQISEASAYAGSINVHALNIFDLTGIASFPSLASLNCNSNQLASLDVSANTTLITLYCSNNYLTSLDVSNNISLKHLECYDNQLTSLNVSGVTNLTFLGCNGNHLASLDISHNIGLKMLWCCANELTSLNVSANTAIDTLICFNNQLTNLDVSANATLTYLVCASNQLTNLNVSGAISLIALYCGYNQLTNLNLSNNPSLQALSCDFNNLTGIDVSNNSALTYLSCNYNQLMNLNVKNGNNTKIPTYSFLATHNPNLACIQVDNVVYANSHWAGDKDITASFSHHCHEKTTNVNYFSKAHLTIIVYPNPTSDQFFIETNTADKLNVDLYDVNGRHVFSASISDKENINIATLDNGAYTLAIKTAGHVINKKLIILR